MKKLLTRFMRTLGLSVNESVPPETNAYPPYISFAQTEQDRVERLIDQSRSEAEEAFKARKYPARQEDTLKTFTNQELIDILRLECYPIKTDIFEKAGRELDRRLTPIEDAQRQ